MKAIAIILLTLLLLGCQQAITEDTVRQIVREETEEEQGTEEQPEEETEPENVAPSVQIVEGDCTAANGSDKTLTVDITDPDNTEHTVIWYVDGAEFIRQRNCTFAAYPEMETEYTLSVTVSDGEAEDSDSVIVTVLAPPWQPEPLHVYVFPQGAEQSDETIVKQYTALDNSNYYTLLNAVKLNVEIHNRDYPDDPWVYVGGGTL